MTHTTENKDSIISLVCFGFLMTFFSFPGQTVFISIFGGHIRHDFDLSNTEFASLYSGVTIASALLLLWSGSLIDRIDLRHFVSAILVMVAFGAFLVGSANGIIALMAGIFIARHNGQGLMYMSSPTTIVRYIPANKSSRATAISDMGYSLSEAIIPPLLVLLLTMMTWQQSWLLMSILLLLLIPIVLWFLRGHDARHKYFISNLTTTNDSTAVYQWQRKEVLKDMRFYLAIPTLNMPSIMFTGFIFHQIYWLEIKGWELQVWVNVFIIYAIIGISFKLIYGILVDRFTAIKILPWMSLPLAISLLVFASSDSIISGVLFMVFMAMSTASGSTVGAPLWAQLYGKKHLGSIKALSSSIMVFTSALSPILIGFSLDLGLSIEQIALIAAIIILLSCILATFVNIQRTQ